MEYNQIIDIIQNKYKLSDAEMKAILTYFKLSLRNTKTLSHKNLVIINPAVESGLIRLTNSGYSETTLLNEILTDILSFKC